MNYVRIAEGLNKYRLIPATENVYNYVKNNTTDYYRSIFFYNDSHYKQWKETGTIAGIKDTVTNSLFFDFDSVKDIKLAQADAVTLVSRLVSHGIPVDDIQIAYSGQKGFSVEIDSATTFTPDEFKTTTLALAGDLSTFDKVVSDPNRIVRLTGTKHPKSGLYKIPLTANQLSELPIEVIKDMATSLDNIDDTQFSYNIVELPTTITKFKIPPKKSETITDVSDLDLSAKPKWISDVRYALQEGFFPTGEGVRNKAFLILAATYKKQGFNKELVYRMLKGVAEVQATRNESDRYPDKELWNNVVQVVFSPQWKGGIYKDSEDPFLLETAKRLGIKIKTDEQVLIPVTNVTDVFRKFATDIDKNTIKLGIDVIDKDVRVTTSMLVGLLAPPSAGKTTISLGVLNSISRSGQKAIFFSLDMGAPLVYQRLLQKHTGVSGKKLFDMYKAGDSRLAEFESTVAKEYSNVSFCFRSGVTTEDIRNYILEHEQATGERVKLVVVDYLECIAGPFSDATANTALIAQQLKDIANDLQITVLLLLQPQKHAGDPSSELLSYRSIKGASVIEQACSIIFTMWRPGFSPKAPEDDKFLTMAVVKNRMGSLGKFDFNWNGLTGEISEMDEMERQDLEELLKRRAAEKAMKEGDL